MHINEALLLAYQDAGATSSNLTEAEYQALVANGAADGKWHTFLRADGWTGSLDEMMYAYLGDKGYAGTISERLYQAAVALDLFGGWTPADIYTGLGDYWIGGDLTRLFTDSAETTNVAANGDPIGSWKGQLDAFSLTEAGAGNKPLWNAADNAVRLPYYKYLSTLVGGNIFVANEPASLFIYAKLVDYSYNAGGELVLIDDGLGYRVLSGGTGGYAGVNGNTALVSASTNGPNTWFDSFNSFPVDEPATAFRAIAMARSDSASTRGVWSSSAHTLGTDDEHFTPWTVRNANRMIVRAAADPFSYKTHVKMIAAGRVALTDDDVANLIAYAEALP